MEKIKKTLKNVKNVYYVHLWLPQRGSANRLGWLLGDVVARERADTTGASVHTDAPAVVIATHHRDKVAFMQLELVRLTRFIVVQYTMPARTARYSL